MSPFCPGISTINNENTKSNQRQNPHFSIPAFQPTKWIPQTESFVLRHWNAVANWHFFCGERGAVGLFGCTTSNLGVWLSDLWNVILNCIHTKSKSQLIPWAFFFLEIFNECTAWQNRSNARFYFEQKTIWTRFFFFFSPFSLPSRLYYPKNRSITLT